MNKIPSDSKHKLAFRSVALLLSTLILCACSSTGTSIKPAQIEIQHDVGFTIVEKGYASGSVRGEYEAALRLLNDGNYVQGLAALEAVVEAAPHLSAPRIDLGIAHHRAGNLEAAESNLLQALEASPNHPIALNELGIVYRKTGRFAEARQSYQSALAIYPGFHFARRNLAVLCDLYLGDSSCALENYNAYMTTVPSDEEASIWISDILMRTGQSEGK